jgi:hypothetical protein
MYKNQNRKIINKKSLLLQDIEENAGTAGSGFTKRKTAEECSQELVVCIIL